MGKARNEMRVNARVFGGEAPHETAVQQVGERVMRTEEGRTGYDAKTPQRDAGKMKLQYCRIPKDVTESHPL